MATAEQNEQLRRDLLRRYGFGSTTAQTTGASTYARSITASFVLADNVLTVTV